MDRISQLTAGNHLILILPSDRLLVAFIMGKTFDFSCVTILLNGSSKLEC